ncbi:MAG: glycoside hydrolase family 15 protein, partial [Thermoplasmata archaeon]
VWDRASLPAAHLATGRATGGAMPLAWAHAEYLKLVRSAADGKVFDRVPEVQARYRPGAASSRVRREVWKPNRQPRSVLPGTTILRFLRREPFRLHVSHDGWRTVEDLDSSAAPLGFHLLDLPLPDRPGTVTFTFYYPEERRWEGRDFTTGIPG